MKRWYLLRNVCLCMILALAMGCGETVFAQEIPAAPPGQPSAQDAPASPKGNVSSDSLRPKIFESWITPTLDGSDLKTHAVTPGDVDTIDNAYTHEVTRVQWRPGDPIDLYIIKPVGVRNPPVILYLYSFPFENDRFLRPDFCKFLVKDGYAAVGFASALTGHRYHDRPMKEWFVSELRESLAESAHDVQMILNYLATRGDLDMDRVGMFGDGSGASIAILSAAVDPRIKTLDLLDPWGDWPDWIKESKRIPEKERPNYLQQDWLAAVAPLDPVKWLPQLKGRKIRMQFIKDLAITPADVERKIEAAAPANAQIVHYDDSAAFRAAVAGGTGFDWIKHNLQFSVVPDYSAAGPSQGKGPSDLTSDSRQ
jgi:hypothetical protein